jgi:hypothetical protein
VAVIGMSTCHIGAERLSDGWYFSQSKLKFLYQLFVFMFIMFYTSLTVLALIKFKIKKRFCTYTNIKIVALSFILFIPLSTQVQRVYNHFKRVEVYLNPEKSQCTDTESPMLVFQKIQNNAYNLLCS